MNYSLHSLLESTEYYKVQSTSSNLRRAGMQSTQLRPILSCTTAIFGCCMTQRSKLSGNRLWFLKRVGPSSSLRESPIAVLCFYFFGAFNFSAIYKIHKADRYTRPISRYHVISVFERFLNTFVLSFLFSLRS